MNMRASDFPRQIVSWLAGAMAWLLVLCGAAAAQDPITVRAGVTNDTPYVGEAIRFHISVNGSEAPIDPDWPPLDGVEVRSLGGQITTQSMTTIINGRRQDQRFEGYVHIYELTFSKPGVHTVPSLSVEIGGAVYRSNPVTVRVLEPQPRPDVRMAIRVAHTSPYVGEAIEMEVTLYLRSSIQRPSLRFTNLEGRFEVLDSPGEGLRGGRRDTIAFLGSQTALERGQATLDGIDFDTFTFRKVLVPLMPGPQTLGPAAFTCEVIVRAARSLFENDQVERITVPSNEVVLEVRPVPEEGRPPHFTGLVGRYRVSARASATDVNVGDPITLTIRLVAGSGVLRDPHLDLAKQPGFAERFRVNALAQEPQRAGDEIVFEQVVRPLSDAITEIPPIEVPYFDTQTGQYAVARSEPIALNVRPTRIVTAGDAEGATVASEIEEREEGIAHNYGASAALVDQRFDLAAALQSPGWLLGLGAPPALYVLTLLSGVWRQRRAGDETARRRRRALATAQQSLAKARGGESAADRAGRAVRQYIGDRFDRPAAGLTTAECVEVVSRLDAALAARLDDLLNACDAARYGGAATAPEDLVDQAARLLEAIDRAAAEVEA